MTTVTPRTYQIKTSAIGRLTEYPLHRVHDLQAGSGQLTAASDLPTCVSGAYRVL